MMILRSEPQPQMTATQQDELMDDHNVKSPTFYNLEVKDFPNHYNTNQNSRQYAAPITTSV